MHTLNIYVVSHIILYSFNSRVQASIDQFKKGLQLGGLRHVIESNPTSRTLLTGQSDKLTLCNMKKLYNISYSKEGSNRRELKEDTIYSWELFLFDCASE